VAGAARAASRLAVLACLFVLAGCAGVSAPPARLAQPTDGFCRWKSKPRSPVCVPAQLVGEQAMREALALTGRADRLTVYVLRNNWADPVQPAEVSLPGREALPTLPRTMLRLSLPAGEHELSVRWAPGTSGTSSYRVAGQSGEVRLLRLVGWAFWSKVDFQLSALDADAARELAAQSRLLADRSY
jgi:hypothetical protein